MKDEFGVLVHDTVLRLIQEVNQPPVLFVGSGLSRRYMGAPDWEGLLRSVCEEVSFMAQYEKYYAKAINSFPDGGKNCILPEAAQLMEDDFIEGVYSDPSWEEWRDLHAESISRGCTPLKLFLAEKLRGLKPSLLEDELAVLRGAERSVGGIITTNYDNLMEDIFPQFEVYSSQSDMLFSRLAEVGEIYKIHGSCSDAATMILDTHDYEKMVEEQKYLLSKILTIFAEHPIIFLGYSFRDEDVRGVLSTIAECAGMERSNELSSRFVFVEYSTDYAVIDKDYGEGIEMKTIRTDNFIPIYRAILESPQRFAPRLVRQLLRQVFEAAYSEDVTYRAMLAPLENLDELPQDKPVVVGFSPTGYGNEPSYDEIMREALFATDSIDPRLVVGPKSDTLIKKYGTLPFYYFISKYNGLLGEKAKELLSGNAIRNSLICKTDLKIRKQVLSSGRLATRSVQGLIEAFPDKPYQNLVALDLEEIDMNDLERMLRSEVQKIPDGKKLTPPLRKGIRILDYLKYGKDCTESSHKSSSPLHSPPSVTPQQSGPTGQ